MLLLVSPAHRSNARVIDRFPSSSHEVDVRSRIEIHVWRKPESKRKGKKRQLAAYTSLTLGELLRKQGASTREFAFHSFEFQDINGFVQKPSFGSIA
jgi:hypothetical protein